MIRRNKIQRHILAALCRQSLKVQRSGDWTGCDDLRYVAHLARVAKPRATSVRYFGINLPLRHSLAYSVVEHPDTRQQLVGAVTI